MTQAPLALVGALLSAPRGATLVFKVARVLGRNFPLVLLLVVIGAHFWPMDTTNDHHPVPCNATKMLDQHDSNGSKREPQCHDRRSHRGEGKRRSAPMLGDGRKIAREVKASLATARSRSSHPAALLTPHGTKSRGRLLVPAKAGEVRELWHSHHGCSAGLEIACVASTRRREERTAVIIPRVD
jgi:hypothetical protein